MMTPILGRIQADQDRAQDQQDQGHRHLKSLDLQVQLNQEVEVLPDLVLGAQGNRQVLQALTDPNLEVQPIQDPDLENLAIQRNLNPEVHQKVVRGQDLEVLQGQDQ